MKLIPSGRAIATTTRYLLIGGAVFAIGLIWNFPYERIRDTLTSLLSQQTGYQFDVDTLSPALPIGFVASGAHVVGPAIGDMPIDLELDRLKLTLSPAMLLYPFRKTIAASYSAQRKTDRFWGSFSFGPGKSAAEFRTKDFKFDRAFPSSDGESMLAGLKLAGILAASLRVEGGTAAMQRIDLSEADGELNLTGKGMTVEAAAFKGISFDKVTVDALLQKGTLTVKSIEMVGPEVTIKAKGSVKLEPFYIRSQVNLEAKVTIAEKAASLRTMAGVLIAQGDGLTIDSTGTIAMKIVGSLDQPDIRPF
ncbi:MAG: type II secretion system protein GspN [Pseudomonadota bacterium]